METVARLAGPGGDPLTGEPTEDRKDRLAARIVGSLKLKTAAGGDRA